MVTLTPTMRGDIIADARIGSEPGDHRPKLTIEEIAAKRRVSTEVVEATLARERAAVARHHAAKAGAEAEVEDEIRAQRRERGQVVW